MESGWQAVKVCASVFCTILRAYGFDCFARESPLGTQAGCHCEVLTVSRGAVTLESASRNNLFPSPSCPTLQEAVSRDPGAPGGQDWGTGVHSPTSGYRRRLASELSSYICLPLLCLLHKTLTPPTAATTEAKLAPHPIPSPSC